MDIQETALTKIRGEAWHISSSDTTFKNLMARRGYESKSQSGSYDNYEIPINAITVRAKSALGVQKGNPGVFAALRLAESKKIDSSSENGAS